MPKVKDSDTKRKTKAPKDPNAPKKPSGPYIFFCNEKRESVKQAHPDYKVAEIGRALGELWKELTDDDKKVCPFCHC